MNDEMVEGYLDGMKTDSPEPSANRSHSYRHGFQNGRDDLARRPSRTAENARQAGAEAIRKDAAA